MEVWDVETETEPYRHGIATLPPVEVDGLPEVLARIREFSSQHDYWEPAPLLERLVAENRDFSAFDASVNEHGSRKD